MLKTIRLLSAWFILVSATLAHAGDIGRGKLLAERWCAACHLVSKNQPKATDQAPPFMGLGRIPGFDENKLAFLLLSPHPNMPALSLDRSEVADLAAYIHSL